MQTIRARLTGRVIRIFWLSLGLGSLFLIVDFLLDLYYFHGGDLPEQFLATSTHEVYLRLSVAFVVAAVVALLSYLLFISGRLQASQRQLEQELAEQKRTHAALQESEERYRLLVDQSPYGITIHQAGKAIFVNQAAVRQMGGQSAEDFVGKPISAFIRPQNWEAARARIERMLQGEAGLYPAEDCLVRLDGSELPVQVTAAPFTFQGQPAVQMIALDISERKRAEAAVAQAEANYRAMVENAAIGIFQSTPAGHYRSVNPALAHIYGYESPAEMLAGVSDIGSQIYVNLADRQAFQRELAERGEVSNFIAENYHRDGSRLWTVTNARTVRDAQGQIWYYEGFLNDITARIHAEEEA
jgi:PAS domain S-box-containing protein